MGKDTKISCHRTTSATRSSNPDTKAGEMQREGLENDDDRWKRDVELQQHKQYAERQKKSRVAEILQLQAIYEQQKVQEKLEVASANEDEKPERPFGIDEYADSSYQKPAQFSWIDSVVSSLHSSFTNQSRPLTDVSAAREELQVEGRIRTEELVREVQNALQVTHLQTEKNFDKNVQSKKMENEHQTIILQHNNNALGVCDKVDYHTGEPMSKTSGDHQHKLSSDGSTVPIFNKAMAGMTLDDHAATQNKCDIELQMLEKTLREQIEVYKISQRILETDERSQKNQSSVSAKQTQIKAVCCNIL
ncbi:uncharacterized protein [Watersipora subatra]|uniref:uncharacterized protein n=1 Tax=Watersipora subatra TaxID=2589382 RepID=UPI00355B0C69